ncbi:MAG: hypothetical protein Phog2KO_00850 [Phototrophicaceae bacterium]
MRFRQRLANIIRKNPFLMRIAYQSYKLIQPKYSIGVVAVVLNDKEEVLLVEHVFHPKLPWGLPGGWIGYNEDPSITAQRELQEELGLIVEVDVLLLTERTQNHHLDFAYLCTAKSDITTLSYELLQYAWFSYDNLPPLHSFHYHAIEATFALIKAKE